MSNEKIESCGKRIQQALSIRKMTQAKLCKLASIPKSSMCLYIKDAYEPKHDRLCDMAKALNVCETWLLGYDVPMDREVVVADSNLTDCEKIMLELFRLIPESQQRILIQMIRGGLATEQ